MQSPSWYYQRLKGMSPAEICWRVSSLCRDLVDRLRVPLRLYPGAGAIRRGVAQSDPQPGFSVSDLPLAAWADSGAAADEKKWLTGLLPRADEAAAHRLSYFDLVAHDHGHPFDWHYDHGNGRRAQRRFSPAIDYRDAAATGDCKYVWEPNRHHHLVVLARAYRASGNMKYAEAIREQLLSWLDQNPFGYGMNWRSPLELSIRLINWVWALDLIRASGVFTGEFRNRVLPAVYLHLWDVTRKFSRGSSANNHLIGEAAGVFVACCYFPWLPEAGRWRRESQAILCREAVAQTDGDGANRELALGYHFFVLQFLLVAGMAGRRSNNEFPPAFWQVVERMMEFLGRITAGGTAPLYGDCDDGYVLDLGNAPHEAGALLAMGAVLFGRPEFKAWAGAYPEAAGWLLGREGRGVFADLDPGPLATCLCSEAFPESGFYLLQTGQRRNGEQIRILVDCGALGYKSIAAHGHADALSFSMQVDGRDVLVDPGTYDYFSFPVWRNYFRSTRAHNTLEVDGQDQSVMLGPFLWGRRAVARCLAWQPAEGGGTFTGEHDGYRRLADPLTHRRTVELRGDEGVVRIIDAIESRQRHAIKIFFHLAPDCLVEKRNGQCLVIGTGARKVVMQFDRGLAISTLCGSVTPPGGWYSAGYHRKTPAVTIVAETVCAGQREFVTSMKVTA